MPRINERDMSNHAEEQAIIETILDYVNEDKTQREPEILRAPTTDYTSERVLDEEIRVLFRNFRLSSPMRHRSAILDRSLLMIPPAFPS